MSGNISVIVTTRSLATDHLRRSTALVRLARELLEDKLSVGAWRYLELAAAHWQTRKAFELIIALEAP